MLLLGQPYLIVGMEPAQYLGELADVGILAPHEHDLDSSGDTWTAAAARLVIFGATC